MNIGGRRCEPVDISGLGARKQVAEQADDAKRLGRRKYGYTYSIGGRINAIADVDMGATPGAIAEAYVARSVVGVGGRTDGTSLADPLIKQPDCLTWLKSRESSRVRIHKMDLASARSLYRYHSRTV